MTGKPLARETWLTYATPHRDTGTARRWILVTTMPEGFYLAGLREANSRSAMVFAVALVLSLMLAAALASMVTAPLRHIASATQAMARGDLSAQAPGSRLEELGALAQSINDMAGRLKTSFDDACASATTGCSSSSELRRHQEHLEALVASRTTELREAKEAAESASQAKSAFPRQHVARDPHADERDPRLRAAAAAATAAWTTRRSSRSTSSTRAATTC